MREIKHTRLKRGKYTVFVRTRDDQRKETWTYKDQLHREDGPAKTYFGFDPDWYLNNKIYTEQGHKIEMRRRKLKELNL